MLVQSASEDLYVKSLGLYTSGLLSVDLATTVLKINLMELVVPLDL